GDFRGDNTPLQPSDRRTQLGTGSLVKPPLCPQPFLALPIPDGLDIAPHVLEGQLISRRLFERHFAEVDHPTATRSADDILTAQARSHYIGVGPTIPV